jgi:hypothetical protein
MNFFDHKDVGNHLLQLCPKVVKHPVYCNVLAVLDHFWPPNVQCLVTDGRQLYLLSYWWHHSIRYTRLFPTPRVVITIFLVTLSSGPPISCLGALLWCLLSWRLAPNWLFVTELLSTLFNWLLLVTDYFVNYFITDSNALHPEIGSWRTEYKTPCRRVNFPLLFKLLSQE